MLNIVSNQFESDVFV